MLIKINKTEFNIIINKCYSNNKIICILVLHHSLAKMVINKNKVSHSELSQHINNNKINNCYLWTIITNSIKTAI